MQITNVVMATHDDDAQTQGTLDSFSLTSEDDLPPVKGSMVLAGNYVPASELQEELPPSPFLNALSGTTAILGDSGTLFNNDTGVESFHYHASLPFPINLHEFLASNPFPSLVDWQHDGKSVIIRDIQLFETIVLPMFSQNEHKFDSFRRQLSRHKFKTSKMKMPDDVEVLVFWNPRFKRDDPKRGADMCR